MKRFTLTMTDDEYEKLEKEAKDNKVTITELINSILFPERKNNIVSLSTVVERALSKQSGDEFAVPDLFSFEEYNGINRGIAGTIGREFSKLVKDDYSSEFEQLGKRNRQTVYIRK